MSLASLTLFCWLWSREVRGGRGFRRFRGFEDVVGLGQKREGRPREAVGDTDGVKCGLQVSWEDSVFLCGWLTVDTGRGGGWGGLGTS